MDTNEVKKLIQDEVARILKLNRSEQFKKTALIPVISGSKGANAALTSLLVNLQKAGIITDRTT